MSAPPAETSRSKNKKIRLKRCMENLALSFPLDFGIIFRQYWDDLNPIDYTFIRANIKSVCAKYHW
jgi:hypothetical protein